MRLFSRKSIEYLRSLRDLELEEAERFQAMDDSKYGDTSMLYHRSEALRNARRLAMQIERRENGFLGWRRLVGKTLH